MKRVLAVLACVALTACGSTVQVRGTVASGLGDSGTNGTGLGSSGSSAGGTTGSTSTAGGGLGGSSSTGATGGTTGPGTGQQGTAGSGGTSGQGGTSSAGDIPVSGPGWDAKTVYIGITTQQDVQSAAQTVGVNSADSGDQKADVEAMISHFNAEGGLFGRKIKGLYFDTKTTGDAQVQSQAACSYFTQDNHVIAVYAAALVSDTDTFRACLIKQHIPILAGGDQAIDDKVFADLKGYYNLMPFPSWSRFARPFADRLAAQKYFTGWDTTLGQAGTAATETGIVCADTPVGRRVGALMTRELTRVGHAPKDTLYYASSNPDVSGYILKFKSDNITHVMMCDIGLFVFATEAESQHYRPRYGVSTFNTPVLFLQGVVPAAQLVGAIGVGYDPTLDVDAQHDPTVSAMPAIATCLAIAKKSGVVYPQDKRFAHGVLYDTCDLITLIITAAKRIHALDGPSIKEGIGLVGPTFSSAVTLRAGLSPTQHANPAGTRDLAYDTSCQCFQYHGGTVPMP